MTLAVWASRKTGKFVVTNRRGSEFVAEISRNIEGVYFVSRGFLSPSEVLRCVNAITLGTIREAEPLKPLS